MTNARFYQLMSNYNESLTPQERDEGWHWCCEWDGLLVGPRTGEWGDDPQQCRCGYPLLRLSITDDWPDSEGYWWIQTRTKGQKDWCEEAVRLDSGGIGLLIGGDQLNDRHLFESEYGPCRFARCEPSPFGESDATEHQDHRRVVVEERAPGTENNLTMTDQVNHPAYYTAGGIEVFDFIEAKGFGFALGNVIKYTSRAGKKGDALTDLRKAKWYLDREIRRLERETGG